MQHATDEEVFARAAQERRVLVSADTDFGTILALREESAPSVILLRRGPSNPSAQSALLLSSLPLLTQALNEAALPCWTKAEYG